MSDADVPYLFLFVRLYQVDSHLPLGKGNILGACRTSGSESHLLAKLPCYDPKIVLSAQKHC